MIMGDNEGRRTDPKSSYAFHAEDYTLINVNLLFVINKRELNGKPLKKLVKTLLIGIF